MDVHKDTYKQTVGAVKQFMQHNELELEIKFGPRIPRDAFSRLISFCKSQAYAQYDHVDTLDIFFSYKDKQYRISIAGTDIIQKYCVSNKITNSKHIKEVMSKTLVPGFRPIVFDDYGFKIDMKNEEVIKNDIFINELLTAMTNANKGYRLKKRFSFTPDHDKWRYDLTVVKRSNNIDDAFVSHKRFSTAIIGSSPETFEVEVELLTRNKQLDTDKLVKDFLKTGTITYAVLNGIENVMSKTEKFKVLEDYVALWKPNAPAASVMIQRPKSFFVGPQPVTLEISNVVSDENALGFETILNNYTVTEKADGERYLLYVDKSGHSYMINNKLDVFDLKVKLNGLKQCIFDGEYVRRDVDGNPIKVFAMFDVYYYNQKSTAELPLMSEEQPCRVATMQGFLKQYKEVYEKSIVLHVKDFVHNKASTFTAVQAVWDMVQADDFIYRIDGLIFTPKNLPVGALYESGQPSLQGPWIKVFKWKPPVENTIDMQVVSEKRVVMVNNQVMNVYQLHIGYKASQWKPIKPKSYFEDGIRPDNSKYTMIPFQPDGVLDRDVSMFYGDKCKNGDIILNNSIVEFAYLKDEALPFPQRWHPLRIRKDKTMPNDFSTAMNVWRSIDLPVTEDIITGKVLVHSANVPNDDVYYKRQADRDKFASRNMMTFHNYWAKNHYLIKQYASGSKSLLDIACGKGGDLKRWLDNGVSTVFGIDKARDNIENANDGIYARLHRLSPKNKQYMFCTMDATEEITDAYVNKQPEDDKYIGKKLLQHGQFDVVSCQFAIHYFFGNEENLDKMLRNVSSFLKPGGYFIGTCMDGSKVLKRMEALQKQESISGKMDDRIIWNIRKNYDEREDFGCEIKVFMESIGVESSEYVVDKDVLNKKVESFGLSKVEITSFEDIYKRVLSADETAPEYYVKAVKDMTDVEKEYSFMNMLFVFRKDDNTKADEKDDDEKPLVIKKKVVKKKVQPQPT